MKLIISLFVVFCGLTACTGSNNNTAVSEHTDTIAGKDPGGIETLCFRRLEGTANQDTSYAQIVINNDKVTGILATIPFEKDSRIGTLLGTRENDMIKGVWVYMQEGMQDTLDVEFKLDADRLVQKSFSVDPKTGRQFLDDKGSFSIEFNKIDCDQLPQKLH